MGLPPDELVVRDDDQARSVARRHGTRGLADRGTVYLDRDHFDPATYDGIALIGHELAHIAQARLVGGRDGTYAEAETEARRIGRQFASGASLSRPRVAYRQPAADGAKAQKSKEKLPDGQNIGFLSDGRIVIRSSWWGSSAKSPEKCVELLRTMKAAQYYWWITEEQIRYVADRFSITDYDPKDEFTAVRWDPMTLTVIGPPPGTDFYFQRVGTDIRVVIRSSSVAPAPATDFAEVKLPRDIKVKLIEALDKYTGIVSAESDRAVFIDAEQEIRVFPAPNAGSRFLIPRSVLEHIYQSDRYQIFLDRKTPSEEQPKPVKQVPTGGGTLITYDADVSATDMDYAGKWLETVRGATATWGVGGPQVAGKTYYQSEIDQMREIDAHPQRAAIIAKLHSYNGNIDYDAMTWAINAAEYESAAQQFGVPAAPTGGARVFPDQVRGDIIVEGLAYPHRTNRIWFRKSNLQSAFLFEIIHTQWVVEEQQKDKSWKKVKGPVETVEVNAREPDYFEYEFEEEGTFLLHAFVNHNWFFPAHFTEPVEVKSEEQRLAEVKSAAFSGMGDIKVASEAKEFDTSLFNEVFGPERFTKGKELGGTLPADWQRMSDDDRLKFIATDKDNLNKLITQYDKPELPYRFQQLASYARSRLKSLEEQEQKLGEEKKAGYMFFEARGAYLSRSPGVADSPLKVVGLAKGEPEKMKLVVHDFTRLFEPEDFTFEAEGGDFSQAAELLFLKLCKRYPAGKLSVLFETISNANIPQKSTVGFELDTNTAWKAVRSAVWDPTVTVIVNLAGAALIIFAPPTATIVLPVLGVYNSIETASKMSELDDSGTLTRAAFAKGVAEIGLNVLPVIGEFKALSIAAKVKAAGAGAVTTADRLVLYGLNGATVGGMLVLMTAEGVEQCRKLQEQDISEVARLLAKLEDLRKRNPNSPDIAKLEAQIKTASDNALKRAAETFANMAKSLAIILVPTAAMAKISKALVGKSLANLIEEGKFVHQAGVNPYYDPVEGVMKGDKAKVTREVMDGLKAQFAADQSLKQLQLEKMAGTSKVEIKYSSSATAVTVTEDAVSGIKTIEAPPGTPFEKVLKDAWDNYFSKQPGASKDMPTLPVGKLEATTKADIIATKPGVQVGRRIETLPEAEGLLRRLADGDRSVFSELGAETPGKTFDPQKVEWGIGQMLDGSYVIIRGDAAFIDWSRIPGVKPIAHSHPISQSLLLSGNKITFADLVKGAGQNAANADKVMPSPADIKFMVESGLTSQTVQTPYVHKGNGVLGNPTIGVVEPKIDIEIVAPERAGLWNGMSDVPVYKAKLRAKASGSVIWEGDVWATHHPEAGSQLMFQEPSSGVMTPIRTGVQGTVTGGGTTFSGAHDFTPANPTQQQALADWQKLQSSPQKYTGKFSWDGWLYQYEKEGLVFDVEARKWKTPEGMERIVETFGADAKAADVVKRLTTTGAGPTGSTSTFKTFFETLVRRKLIKDTAELEALIEKDISYKERPVDYVRHKLKERFKPQLMDQGSPSRWDNAKVAQVKADPHFQDLPWSTDEATAKLAAGHREMTDIVKDLDSADKGPMFEQWLAENEFPQAKSQVAAPKSAVDAQLKSGEALGKDRKIDLLDNETAVEAKTVNDTLSADEASLDPAHKPTSQLLDYLRMVSSEVKLTVKGQTVTLKKLKYVFTTTKGAIANLDTIKDVLRSPEFKGKVTFDVHDPKGIRRTISSLSDLSTPDFAWLKK